MNTIKDLFEFNKELNKWIKKNKKYIEITGLNPYPSRETIEKYTQGDLSYPNVDHLFIGTNSTFVAEYSDFSFILGKEFLIQIKPWVINYRDDGSISTLDDSLDDLPISKNWREWDDDTFLMIRISI